VSHGLLHASIEQLFFELLFFERPLRELRARERALSRAADLRSKTSKPQRELSRPHNGRLFYWCSTGRPQPEENHDPLPIFSAVDQPFPARVRRNPSGRCPT
jgi:hypothetical protein